MDIVEHGETSELIALALHNTIELINPSLLWYRFPSKDIWARSGGKEGCAYLFSGVACPYEADAPIDDGHAPYDPWPVSLTPRPIPAQVDRCIGTEVTLPPRYRARSPRADTFQPASSSLCVFPIWMTALRQSSVPSAQSLPLVEPQQAHLS